MKRLNALHTIGLLVVIFLCGGTMLAQPPKPTSLPPTFITSNSFQANWDTTGYHGLYQIQHYLLDVSIDPNFATFFGPYHNASIGTGPEVVGSVTVSSLYYYRVRAVNASGPSVYSDVVAAPIVLPTTALAATSITPTSFVAHWTAANGVTNYRLDVAKLASFGPVVHTLVWDQAVAGQGTTSYAVTGLGADTTYFFRVRTESAAGVSTNSNTITVSRIISASPLPSGTINVPYSEFLQVASDNGVSGWTVTSGSLPAGLTLDGPTGILSGTPTGVGASTFTAQASDGSSTISKSFTLSMVSTPTIDYDAVAPGQYDFSGGASFSRTLTWLHTVAPRPAANRMLLVQAGSTGLSTLPLSNIVISGVTYNGVAMTRAVRKSESNLVTSADFLNVEQWYLLDANLPVDSLPHSVVVSYAGLVTGTAGGSLSLKNVAQNAPEVTATDSIIYLHLGKSITTLSNNSWLVNAAVNGYSGTFYPVRTQEPRLQIDNGNFDLIVDTKDRTVAGLDSMLANHHIEYRMAQVILALAPAGSQPNVNIKAFLAGPYVTPGDSMTNGLKTGGQLAAHFTGRPIPALAVDSIAIEIRDSLTVAASHTRQFAPAWLLTNGSIRDFNDTTKSYVTYGGANVGNYYIVVRHRNHLAVMNPTPVSLTAALNPAAYDFSTAQAKGYGTNPMIATGTRFSLYAGDVNGDGVVKYNAANNDRALIYSRIGGVSFTATVSGYFNEDVNLDGTVRYNAANNDRALIYSTIGGASFIATVTSRVP